MEIRGIDVSAWQGKLTGKQLLIMVWVRNPADYRSGET